MRWDRQNQFVIAGFVSTYFTVILPGFQMFVIAGCHCNNLLVLLNRQEEK